MIAVLRELGTQHSPGGHLSSDCSVSNSRRLDLHQGSQAGNLYSKGNGVAEK